MTKPSYEDLLELLREAREEYGLGMDLGGRIQDVLDTDCSAEPTGHPGEYARRIEDHFIALADVVSQEEARRARSTIDAERAGFGYEAGEWQPPRTAEPGAPLSAGVYHERDCDWRDREDGCSCGARNRYQKRLAAERTNDEPKS